jgi:hypothetical protein
MPNIYNEQMVLLHWSGFGNEIEFSEGLLWNGVQLSERLQMFVSVVVFSKLWLPMARPSKCAYISNMVVDSEEEISIDDECENFPSHQ